jgi:L-serine dehydratase
VFHRREKLPLHSNGMRFSALDRAGAVLAERIYYSVGGGFVVDELGQPSARHGAIAPRRCRTRSTAARSCSAQCQEHGLSISTLMLENERPRDPEAEVRAGCSPSPAPWRPA